MKNNFAVTTGRGEGSALCTMAKSWAAQLGACYIERTSKGSLAAICDEYHAEALLVATNAGPQVFTKQGVFFFHPGMAVLRLQHLQNGSKDHLLSALAVKAGMRVLDCTMGLAGDAAIISYAVGPEGLVVGLEASKLLHFVVTNGLQVYQALSPELNNAMRRINTINIEASEYLASARPDSFDAVYFDPMFQLAVSASSNMQPLRPLAYNKPLAVETVQLALRVAPRVIIKERSAELLRQFGCTEIFGGKYSRVKYGVTRRL